MAGEPPRTGPLTLVSGAIVVIGGVVVVASLLWETVVVADTTVDVFVIGGAVFAIGFALGGIDRWYGDERRRGAAQVVSAVGWAGFVWGSSGGTTAVLYGGFALLVVGGLVLFGADEWIEQRL